MRLGELVQALRRGDTVSLREAFLRFEDSGHPDRLGPPGRLPIIQALEQDARLVLDQETATVRLR